MAKATLVKTNKYKPCHPMKNVFQLMPYPHGNEHIDQVYGLFVQKYNTIPSTLRIGYSTDNIYLYVEDGLKIVNEIINKYDLITHHKHVTDEGLNANKYDIGIEYYSFKEKIIITTEVSHSYLGTNFANQFAHSTYYNGEILKNIYPDCVDFDDKNRTYFMSFRFLIHPDEKHVFEFIKDIVSKYIVTLPKREDTPKINLIAKDCNGYKLIEKDLSVPETNLELYYHDDLVQEHENIVTELSEGNKGVFLFHGLPGTGKTTYIMHLMKEMINIKKEVIFLPNSMASVLADPTFIEFLLDNTDSILVIEDAEKILISREVNPHGAGAISNLLQLTDGFLSNILNIQVIATFNTNISKIDTAILRKGRCKFRHEFNVLPVNKVNAICEQIGIEPLDKEVVLGDIFNSNDMDSSDDVRTQVGFSVKR